MPILTRRGQVVAGVGGGTVSVDNQPIARGGAACALSDDEVIFNGSDETGHWVLRIYDLRTRQIRTIDPRGANQIAAGGGRWAAQADSLYANFAFSPGARMSLTITDERGGASPTGVIALCPDPSCTAVDLYAADGSTVHIPAIAYNLCIVGPGQAVWDGGSWGLTLAAPLPLSRRRVVRLADGDWIVGWSNAVGLVAVRSGDPDGYILTRGLAFHHDAQAVEGQLVVAWATSQGEAPGTNVVVMVDRTAPHVPLVPPPPPPPVHPTFTFDHAVLVAPFKDPLSESGAPAEVVVNQAGQTTRRPAFVAADSLLGRLGPLLGIYSEAPAPSGPIALAAQLRTRLLLAHDARGDWQLPAGLRPWDIPLIELYLAVGEAPGAAPARHLAQMRSLLAQWPYTCGVIPMFYDQGGAPPTETWPVAMVLTLLQNLSAVVNLSPRIQVILPFAWQRANGIVAHPELRTAFAALLREQQRVGLATLPPIPGPPPPPPPPVPRFPPAQPYRIEGPMVTESGGILGPGGKFGRMGSLGQGLFGWRPILWDGDSSDLPTYRFTATEVSPGRFTCVDAATGSFLGADLTQFSADLTQQFYGKPADLGVGEYETFFGFGPLTDAGVIMLIVRYPVSPDRPHAFLSTPATWVRR